MWVFRNWNYTIKNTKTNINLIYNNIDKTKYKILVKNNDYNFFEKDSYYYGFYKNKLIDDKRAFYEICLKAPF